jgi:hypothetical protein
LKKGSASTKLGISNLKPKSGLSMKKTLSMRKLADPRETEMFEKCDLADALERLQI